jgi:pyruvate formate lyase activating enzyme
MGQLYAITPFTQLDYPGELACIAWISGCNLRCAYCHNPDIVLKRGQKDDDALLSFLKSRQGLLTGVVFSGGEATFCPSLPELARQAKAMGYKIKLDTNGTNPEMVRELQDERILNAVALDYKCPPYKAESLLGTTLYGNAFRETLSYLIDESRAGNILLEIRTTHHPDFLDESDLNWIIGDLDQRGYRGTYWLQNIVTSGEKTLGNVAAPAKAIDRQKLSSPKNFDIGYRNFPA